MCQIVKMASLAALMALGTGASAQPVSAQDFGIRIGPDRPQVIERRIYREDEPRRVERRVYRDEGPRVIERRVIRRPAPRRTVCTTRWRDGRQVEVCRTAGPRY